MLQSVNNKVMKQHIYTFVDDMTWDTYEAKSPILWKRKLNTYNFTKILYKYIV